jgi:hypothetical protein
MSSNKDTDNIEESKILKTIEAIKASNLDSDTKSLVIKILMAFSDLLGIIQKKETTIGKLKRLIFGKTESAKNLLGNKKDKAENKSDKADSSDKPAETKGNENSKKDDKPKAPGHGRKSHAEFAVQNEIYCAHGELKSGDNCPLCEEGKLYKYDPSNFIQFIAQPLLNATKYILEKFRCNACLAIFEAKLPSDVLPHKYDVSVGVAFSIYRSGFALPSYRMEAILKCQGIPFSDSQMFVLQEEVAKGVNPIIEALITECSNSEHFNIDDTTGRIQKLTIANKTKTEKERKGVFTVAMNSFVESHPVVLFFTGRKHAGEILEDVLKIRTSILPFFVMGDGSSKNTTDNPLAQEVNCNAHNRRKFVDIQEAFPDSVEMVIECYKEIYKNESHCKKTEMSPPDRLKYHKEFSLPIMVSMQAELEAKIVNKVVEPNSSLGKAITYFTKRYEKLIGFCMYAGVPIDNNQCERAIKKFVLTRKNSMQYRTEHGAWVGERLMTLIHTAISNKVDPFKYLVVVMKNLKRVELDPRKWFPWNYHLNFASGSA